MIIENNQEQHVDERNDKKLIICIPAYNEERNIEDIVRKCKKYATEVVVCDDGSEDNTYSIARETGATVLHNSTNKGYGAALNALFKNARISGADIMITIDSDGQHDPDEIPALIRPILEGKADLVIGSRFLNDDTKNNIPIYRKVGIKAITTLARHASFANITDAQSGFRAYGKRALQVLTLVEEGMRISTEILVQARDKNLVVKEVPITVRYNIEDTSTHNPIIHGMNILSSLIQLLSLRRPLLFYGLPGVILLIVAAFYTGEAVELFSTTRYVSTNLILVSVALSIIGIILIATGAIVYTLIALFKGKLKEI